MKTENPALRIETIMAMIRSLHPRNANYEKLRDLLDQVCSQVAQRFSLYSSDKKPRKATIISVIAKSSCLSCITRMLSAATADRVDALYLECHRLAVDVLVEELYSFLQGMGYNVLISTEAELDYGKADVAITITRYGLNVKCNTHELLIEIKTGNSFSLSQLFRYLMDERSKTIVVWRVRRRQTLVFEMKDIKPLLMEFMRIVYLRGTRLLSTSKVTCQHTRRPPYQPTSEALQRMFQDFAGALMETLPVVLETVLQEIESNSDRA